MLEEKMWYKLLKVCVPVWTSSTLVGDAFIYLHDLCKYVSYDSTDNFRSGST
jgi:hypothetical protein